MKCLLDLDGVLVDFVKGTCKLHGKENPYPAYPGWDMGVPLGMTMSEICEPMGRGFWAELEWTEDGERILNAVEAAFGPENICLLTSPVTTDGCIDGKMDWIKRHLPRYKRRFLVGPAKHFCANPTHVLIDDNDDNICDFRESGGRVILVPRPWNANRHIGDAAGWIAHRLSTMAIVDKINP